MRNSLTCCCASAAVIRSDLFPARSTTMSGHSLVLRTTRREPATRATSRAPPPPLAPPTAPRAPPPPLAPPPAPPALPSFSLRTPRPRSRQLPLSHANRRHDICKKNSRLFIFFFLLLNFRELVIKQLQPIKTYYNEHLLYIKYIDVKFCQIGPLPAPLNNKRSSIYPKTPFSPLFANTFYGRFVCK